MRFLISKMGYADGFYLDDGCADSGEGGREVGKWATPTHGCGDVLKRLAAGGKIV